ncbi:ORF6N domain-containing protein [Butyrivibrio sp. INlla21]|uniref:ORF6N domain-containing protein n=1 Tax=Butyrivibrio sp. INlla21 TaxID=1520811 RepID=UPI0008E6E625|nr:ORF6N domain-containing protein [Butyrivibrio sp. INlla21]SFU74682.1 ORF6N domain-containing protein [Butyrivibrio sp. INlla21]
MNQKKKSELTNSEIAVIEVTEEYLRDRIYYIRGHKVLLDADIAEIYGYTNKRFNEQVRNNIIKFDSDFMFELSDDELEDLRTKFSSANISSKSRYNPHVFTEQGLYMLMTVLKGELATKQSKALIRTFKKMKDYILDNQSLIGQREVMQLSMQTIENTAEISKIRMDIGSVEKQMSDVMDQLNDVVTKSELADMMNSFVSDEDNGWLLYNTKYCSADVAYSSIYGQAKKSVYVIDNYIGLRTLVMLKNVPSGVDIKLFSDNVGSGKLHNVEYNDFLREYPGLRITMLHTGGVFHDRFIVLDYGTKDERVFLCGASSKDAGARITTIVEDFGVQKYDPIIKKLLKNAVLVLP